MRSFFLTIMLSFMLLIYVKGSYAYSSFTNYVNNPLHHDFVVLQHSTTFENGEYHMFFTGFNENNRLAIGHAVSSDGISWNLDQFIKSETNRDFHDPSFLNDSGVKKLYYISEPNEGSGVDIQFKQSTLDSSYQIEEENTVVVPRQTWNSQKISCPSIYQEEGEKRLFYCGTNGFGWKVGMSTSSDGLNFTPCSNPILTTASNYGNAQLMKDSVNQSAYHLYVHTDSGIEHYTTQGIPQCSSVWTSKGVVVSKSLSTNSSQIISPDIVHIDNQLRLFYTGRSSSSVWKLHLASADLSTQEPLLVFIPGLLGSWNKEAIMHNTPTSISEWELSPFVREYDGLIHSLNNQGYVEGEDYIIAPYDWRKDIGASIDDLYQLLESDIWSSEPNRQINFIGHSLGGVIARVFAQQYPDKVSHISSVASPHKGTAYAYRPVEAGEFETEDNSIWMAGKILLALNYGEYASDEEAIHSLLPVVNDLFPTYPLLTDEHNNVIPIENMEVQNSYLSYYNDEVDLISDRLTTFYSSANNSLFGYQVTSNKKKKGEEIYPDGRPTTRIVDFGDGFVTAYSEQIGSDTFELNYDHGQIMANADALKQIFQKSDIVMDDENIEAGGSTKLIPSLIFLMQSPATMEVEADGVIYEEQDGLIFISNTQTNEYIIRVKGLEKGRYTLTVGQNSLNSIVWEQVIDEIVADEVNAQVDEFKIQYNQQKSTPQLENEGICKRKLINKKTKKYNMDIKCKKVKHSKV